jgi:branched-chain amino acid transport system permease protein
LATHCAPAAIPRCAPKAMGIDVRATQWVAFAVAGAFAGLAGGVYAFSKGSISPEALAIPRSVDALVIVLLGGINALAGPLLGAAAFTVAARFAGPRHRVLAGRVGGMILILVLVFPMGIGGALQRLVARYKAVS